MSGFKINSIKSSPSSVKYGLGFLLCGWVWFLYSVHAVYDKTFLGRFLIGGGVVFACVLQFKKWARMLALLSNGMTILYCSFFVVAFQLSGSDFQLVFVSAVNVLLFALSSYFLFLKKSADFFESGAIKDTDKK